MKRISASILAALLVVGGASLMPGCRSAPSAPQGAAPLVAPPTGPAAPGANARPFPQSALIRNQLANPPALPSNVTQEEMEARILGLFGNILRDNIIVDTHPDHQTRETFRIVFQHRSSWPGGASVPGSILNNVHNITVSESHGYGMMILALMAGSEGRLDFDDWLFGGNIRDYFDAMVRTMQGFPSARRRAVTSLMSWRLWGYSNEERDADLFHATGNPGGIHVAGYRLIDGIRLAPFRNEGDHLGAVGNSATDGDIDMLYALILADRQWGSDGAIDYMGIAQRKLADFYRFCIHRDFRTLTLGDWATPGTTLGDATRASDFILSHLVTFRDVDEDPGRDWQAVIDATLNVIWEIRSYLNAQGSAFQNGLLPDFIVRQGGGWAVPPGQILESQHDGRWHWNSVRVPWRMGTTYMLFGDMPVGDSTLYDMIIAPLDDFARTRPGGFNIGTMNMNGAIVGSPGAAMVRDFATPFVVTAAARGNHPNQWIDEFWGPRIPNGMHYFQNNVYGDYFRLIALITASGNYWIP